ncbi:MAG: YgjV family protein [Clostridia bacterium]|nr:YgjV family protein [Clostridia bacterium]
MNWAVVYEIIGYVGTGLILVSMLMTSVVRLRVINLIGSGLFAIYAVLIRSYPTAILNACLVAINVYQLLKLKRKAGKGYEIQRLCGTDGFAGWFLNKYGDDVRTYFPGIDADRVRASEGFAVLMDDCAAGVLLGTRSGERFDVLLDYTTPTYRDCSVGRFIYEKLPSFGITELSCAADSPAHAAYLEKMGFTKGEDGVFVKPLTGESGRS